MRNKITKKKLNSKYPQNADFGFGQRKDKE